MSDLLSPKQELLQAVEQVKKMNRIFRGFEHLERVLEVMASNEQSIAEKTDQEFRIRVEVEALCHKKKVLEEEISKLEGSFSKYDAILVQVSQAEAKLTEVENQIVQRESVAAELDRKILDLRNRLQKLSELAGQV